MREFDTGATRDSEEGKFDYEGFLSSLVLWRYAKYMTEHRMQADGKLRDSDNWQKGMPLSSYMKSMWRHFMDLWMQHRHPFGSDSSEEALCAIIFNASGYLHEMLMAKRRAKLSIENDSPAEEDIVLPAPTTESLEALKKNLQSTATDAALAVRAATDEEECTLTPEGWEETGTEKASLSIKATSTSNPHREPHRPTPKSTDALDNQTF